MIKNNLRRLAAIGAVSGMLTAGLATAAFAGTTPVQVSGQINQSVTLTGLTSSIAFPATDPGQSGTATGAESYQVASNDAAGYTVTITPGAAGMSDVGGHQLDNSNVSVTEKTPGSGASFTFNSNAQATVDSTHASGGKTYSEDWNWNIPGSQPAGQYSESFSYLVMGNA